MKLTLALLLAGTTAQASFAESPAKHYETLLHLAGEPLELGDGDFVFASREATLDVLERLPEYPGHPTGEGLLVHALPKTDPSEIWPALTTGSVPTVGYYRIARNLATSAAHYPLSEDERRRAVAAVLTYVKKDLLAPTTFLDVKTRLELVRHLVAKKLLVLSGEKPRQLAQLGQAFENAAAMLKVFHWGDALEGVRTNAEFKALPPNVQRKVYDCVLIEIRVTHQLRAGLRRLVSDLVY